MYLCAFWWISFYFYHDMSPKACGIHQFPVLNPVGPPYALSGPSFPPQMLFISRWSLVNPRMRRRAHRTLCGHDAWPTTLPCRRRTRLPLVTRIIPLLPPDLRHQVGLVPCCVDDDLIVISRNLGYLKRLNTVKMSNIFNIPPTDAFA